MQKVRTYDRGIKKILNSWRFRFITIVPSPYWTQLKRTKMAVLYKVLSHGCRWYSYRDFAGSGCPALEWCLFPAEPCGEYWNNFFSYMCRDTLHIFRMGAVLYLLFNNKKILFYYSVLAAMDLLDARIFILLSSAGITALFPLLHLTDLTPLKILLILFYTILSSSLLIQRHKQCLLQIYEWIYVGSLPLIIVYETCIHGFLFDEQLPFLPLAITSIYCSLGVTYSFLLYYYVFVSSELSNLKWPWE